MIAVLVFLLGCAPECPPVEACPVVEVVPVALPEVVAPVPDPVLPAAVP